MPPDPHAGYQSPLETRNASAAMRAAWSARRKFGTWRRIWVALAESQQAVGLPVTAAQVKKAREANKGRTAMYTPEEILKEHPFPAGK